MSFIPPALVRLKYLIVEFVIGTIFVSYFFAAREIGKKAIARAAFGPDFYPMLVAVVVVALCALLFCFDLYALSKKRGTSESTAAAARIGEKKQTKTVLVTLLFIVAYIALLDILGFILSTFLYLTLQISLLSPKAPTKRSILLYGSLSAVFASAVYFIFTEFFLLMLPAGILG